MRQVIGVVGPIASGKGSIIEFFQKKGYQVISLSDVIRQKALERNIPLTRENLQNIGDELRREKGAAILAQRISPILEHNPSMNFIIDSIRNPSEVEFLKQTFAAYIIGITASAKRRYEFIQKRAREWDPKTQEEFEKAETRDRGIGQDTFGQQVEKCLAMADIVIENDGSIENLQQKIRHVFPLSRD